MAYVVAEPCIACKYTDCVAVCPVECFYEGENFLVINPDECIDCGACVPECPTEAIFEEVDLPEEWEAYTELNAKYSGAAQDPSVNPWPVISEQKEPLPEADKMAQVEGKLLMLSPNPAS